MNYVEAPERSLVQRMEALAKANDIRVRRGNFKKQMFAHTDRDKSKAVAIEAILDPPDFMESMKLMDLLMAVRGFGRTKTNKYLVRLRISPAKTLGGLSPRQRAEVAQAIRDGLAW